MAYRRMCWTKIISGDMIRAESVRVQTLVGRGGPPPEVGWSQARYAEMTPITADVLPVPGGPCNTALHLLQIQIGKKI